MDVSFSCDKCGQHILIDASGAGLSIQCPNCEVTLTVPQPVAAVGEIPQLESVADSSSPRTNLPGEHGESDTKRKLPGFKDPLVGHAANHTSEECPSPPPSPKGLTCSRCGQPLRFEPHRDQYNCLSCGNIQFRCTKCGQSLEIEEAGAGLSVQCPNCGVSRNLTQPAGGILTEAPLVCRSVPLLVRQNPPMSLVYALFWIFGYLLAIIAYVIVLGLGFLFLKSLANDPSSPNGPGMSSSEIKAAAFFFVFVLLGGIFAGAKALIRQTYSSRYWRAQARALDASPKTLLQACLWGNSKNKEIVTFASRAQARLQNQVGMEKVIEYLQQITNASPTS